MKRILIVLSVLSIGLLLACGAQPEPTAAPVQETAPVSPLPTPTPEAASSSPTETPTVSEPATPTVDAGLITGVLLRGSPPEPLSYGVLYLGKVILENGVPAVASMNKTAAPSARLGPDGQFAFEQVPPGQYALMLDLITSTIILRHPETGGDLLIDSVAGQTTDLGELVFSDLPAAP